MRENPLEAINDAAKAINGKLTCDKYRVIYKKFDGASIGWLYDHYGSWASAKEEAGVTSEPQADTENKSVIELVENTATCTQCEEEFLPSSGSTEQYCSHSCMGKHRDYVEEKNPNYSGGKEERTCDFCGEVFERYSSKFNGSDKVYCSPKCKGHGLDIFGSGKDNLNYNGGGGDNFTEAIRLRLSDEWMIDSVKCRRNSGKCEMCGKSRDEVERLCAHHIVPVLAGGTNEQANLMSVCSSCHPKVESKIQEITTPHLINNG